MKQQERASVMRLASDIVRAYPSLSCQQMDLLILLKEKYRISRADERQAFSLTMADAVKHLRSLDAATRRGLMHDIGGLLPADVHPRTDSPLLLLAMTLCLSPDSPCESCVYSVQMPPDVVLDTTQVLYVEGEFYPDVNSEIESHYRELTTELLLMGLHLVYIPHLRHRCQSFSGERLQSLLSFLYPSASEEYIQGMVSRLSTFTTADFCREGIVGRMRIREFSFSLPSLLLYLGRSQVGDDVVHNFLSLTLERDVLSVVRDVVDLYSRLYPRRLPLPADERLGDLFHAGFYRQILDVFSSGGAVRSSVVVDARRGEIRLPEAGVSLTRLHRREKALYTLFLLEADRGGINFSKPQNARALQAYERSMRSVQARYATIYEHFGGDRHSAPMVVLPEIRLPMLSIIKGQVAEIAPLLTCAEDYLVRRNVFGNYSLGLSADLCLCVDEETGRVCRFGESPYWHSLLNL